MQLEASAAGAMYRPNDALAVNWANFGLENEPFRITKQNISGGPSTPMRVTLDLLKEDPNIFAWNPATDERDKLAGPLPITQTGLEAVTPSGLTVTPIVLTSVDRASSVIIQSQYEYQ